MGEGLVEWEEGLAAWVKRWKRGLSSMGDGRGKEMKRREEPHVEKKESKGRGTRMRNRERRKAHV